MKRALGVLLAVLLVPVALELSARFGGDAWTDAALDVVNATPGRTVVLRLDGDFGERDVVTFDARGKEQSRRRLRLDKGLHEIDVPPSGLLTISGPGSP